MRRDHQIETLHGTPLFADLSKSELREILRIAREVEFREGSVITREGQVGQDFFLILSGEVKVEREGRHQATLGAGEYFGETALLTGGARTATVTATSRVGALRLSSADFLSVLDRMPGVARKILVTVARRLA